LSGHYPPGVTGNEPQICGTGLEDKCMRCADKADEDSTLASIPDGVIEYKEEFLCVDCFLEKADGELTKPQKKAMRKLSLKWQCAYATGISMQTLDALVRKGVVEHKCDILGSCFSPTTANKYRIK
jgi:polyferredoxin